MKGRKPKRIMRRKDNRLGYGNQYLDVFENHMILHLRGQPDIHLEPQIAKDLAWKITKATQVQAQVAHEKLIDKDFMGPACDVIHVSNPNEEFRPRPLGIPRLSDKKLGQL